MGHSKSLLLLLCALLLSCSDADIGATRSTERPNVVVVLADAMRRDHLGVYGYKNATSPNLDRLAEKSIVFENAYSHGSHTIVSTASLLTSRVFSQIVFVDPQESPDRFNTRIKEGKKLKILVPQGPSLPEVFSGAGYRSVAVLTNPHHHERSGFPNLFDEPIFLLGASESNPDVPYHDAQSVADEFFSWLKSHGDADMPFLAYLHFMDPHNPYSAPKPYSQQFVTTQGRDRYFNGIPSEHVSPSHEDLEFMRQNYDAEIAFFDDTFSSIVEFAGKTATRPTIFVVTSDHGEEFMDHGGLGHGQTLHKEQIWVPLIFIGTGREPGRIHTLARHIDIAPTLAGLAGLESDNLWEGRDLLSTEEAQKEKLSVRTSIAYSHHGIWSLTTEEWHFSINRRTDEKWLYDNLQDATGRVNLAEIRRDVVEELTSDFQFHWKAWKENQKRAKDLQQQFTAASDYPAHDQVLESLRQLGYVE